MIPATASFDCNQARTAIKSQIITEFIGCTGSYEVLTSVHTIKISVIKTPHRVPVHPVTLLTENFILDTEQESNTRMF